MSEVNARVIYSARLLWTGFLALALLAGCAQTAKYDSQGEVELSESEQVALEFERDGRGAIWCVDLEILEGFSLAH